MKYDRAGVISRRTQLQIQDVTALWWVTKECWRVAGGPYRPTTDVELREATRDLYSAKWPAKVVDSLNAYNDMRERQR